MAYDRYDTRDESRDERSRWRDDGDQNRMQDRSDWDRDRGGRQGRGFFERAGDEVASWFGDEDAERRRRQDQRMSGNERNWRGSNSRDRDYNRDSGPDYDRDQTSAGGWDRSRDRGGFSDQNRDWNDNRGAFASGGSSERDYNREWRGELWGSGDRDRDRERGWDRDRESNRSYRPLAGDYGRGSEGRFSTGGMRGGRDRGEDDRSSYQRSQSPWGLDEYRSTSRGGTSDLSDRSRHEGRDFGDPQYSSWRRQHIDDLDRDYDDYRRENQSRFENDFSGWRERRTQKRGLLGEIREHMEVVGKDDEHVGTVDKTAGDRIILTKSDPESGGVHHSISCSDVDRVEKDRVILDCTADQARKRWRDESRSRALFERDDQGEMGPRTLDRSFSGTYR